MRIAHISDCFSPRLGGIEVQVAELARHQVEAGHEVAVITATPGAGETAGPEVRDGYSVFRTAVALPFDIPVHPRTAHVVRPVLAGWRPDAVHVHVGLLSPFAWGGLRAALRIRTPTVVTVHSVWGGPTQAAYRRFAGSLHANERGVAFGAVSSLVAQRVRQAMGPEAQVVSTPNGVDVDYWRRARPHGRPGPVRFVTAMRLAPRKRALPLVDMFADVVAQAGDAPVSLTVAGDGPDRGRLEGHIRSRGLGGSIELVGRLERGTLRRLYEGCHVYVQPSVMESFGLAALEARTAGLPVVARDQSGVSDFVADGVSGLLAADDAAMAAAMHRLVADPDLRDAITTHNTAVPPDQSWPRVLAAVDAAYSAAGLRSSRDS